MQDDTMISPLSETSLANNVTLYDSSASDISLTEIVDQNDYVIRIEIPGTKIKY